MALRVCIAGIGAIGGSVAASLSGADVVLTLLARGESGAAIRDRGLIMRGSAGERNFRLNVVENAGDIGVQDIVYIATKGHALPVLAPAIAPIIGQHTIIVPLLNGVPWWFFWHLQGVARDLRLQSVDPDGVVSRYLPPDQVIGAVLHLSVTSPQPGVIVRGLGNDIILGDPRALSSTRLDRVCSMLSQAGFRVRESANIHQDVWYKLWGNISFNPISALTRATTDSIAGDPDTRTLCASIMIEAAAVSERLGIRIDASVDSRIAYAEELGRFKTSMLQDVEAGKRLEVLPILGAVAEIAEAIELPVPHIRAMLGLTRLLDQSLAEQDQTP